MANTAVVYDRKFKNRELNFEASGALMDASLIMRDQETDSWWSIMTSNAIGGEFDGTDLVELPRGEKTTWKKWRQQHPNTLVLSVGGEEHVDNNPYDNYFASDETFRGLQIDDRRLKPKDPIYSFWWQDEPYAVPHAAFDGGKIFSVPGWEDERLFLYRRKNAPIFESSRAFVVPADLAAQGLEPKDLLARVESDADPAVERLAGFDTFWYNWVAVNEDTKLVR